MIVPHRNDGPIPRLVFTSKIAYSRHHISNAEALVERRHNVESRWLSYQKRTSMAYNKKLRPRTFTIGDLVLKAAGHAANQKGPSVVLKDYDNGYFLISRRNSNE